MASLLPMLLAGGAGLGALGGAGAGAGTAGLGAGAGAAQGIGQAALAPAGAGLFGAGNPELAGNLLQLMGIFGQSGIGQQQTPQIPPQPPQIPPVLPVGAPFQQAAPPQGSSLGGGALNDPFFRALAGLG